MRRAVEAADLAELPCRAGRVWAAVDAHQLPYCGRGKPERYQQGWAGAQGRPLRALPTDQPWQLPWTQHAVRYAA